MRHVIRGFTVLVLSLTLLTLVGCGTAIPDLSGMSLDKAKTTLEGVGLRVGQVEYDPDADGDSWDVVSQTPAAGERVDEASAVDVVVAGAPPVDVPQLVGLDKGQAEAVLRAVKLVLGDVQEAFDASAVAGVCLSQEPTVSVSVEQGSSVSLVVSKGPKPVAIPDVVGKTQADATTMLTAATFKVEVKQQTDPKVRKGSVVSQDPKAGTEIAPGSKVALVVSTGPPVTSSASTTRPTATRPMTTKPPTTPTTPPPPTPEPTLGSISVSLRLTYSAAYVVTVNCLDSAGRPLAGVTVHVDFYLNGSMEKGHPAQISNSNGVAVAENGLAHDDEGDKVWVEVLAEKDGVQRTAKSRTVTLPDWY